MDYLEACKKLHDKLEYSDKIKLYKYIQSSIEKDNIELESIREQIYSKLKEVEFLSKQYINNIFNEKI